MPEPSKRGTRYVLGPGGNSRDFWDTLAAMESRHGAGDTKGAGDRVISALEHCVERGPTDLCEARDLGLGNACGERLWRQFPDRSRLLARLCLRRCASLAVARESRAYLIVHANNFTWMLLTSPGHERKVLYMETTQNLTIGTTVSYEDMANPLCKGVVADIETTRWGTQYIIAWNGYRAGEITASDCRQAGWKVS